MKKLIPFAHRGVIEHAPENTLEAFKRASALGCSVEMDIQFTLDGQIIVFHDSDFRRLGLGTELANFDTLVSKLTLEQIEKIKLPYAGHTLTYFPKNGYTNESHCVFPWHLDSPENIIKRANEYDCLDKWENSEPFLWSYKEQYEQAFTANQKTASVMDFADFLAWVKTQPDNFMAEIEYKSYNLDEKVFEMIEKVGVSEKCIVMSGVPEYYKATQEFISKNGKPNGLKVAANLRWLTKEHKQMIENWDLFEVGLNANDYDENEVKYLADKGIKVFSNLGDTPEWWTKMQTNGTYAFKTNFAEHYLNWLKDYK